MKDKIKKFLAWVAAIIAIGGIFVIFITCVIQQILFILRTSFHVLLTTGAIVFVLFMLLALLIWALKEL